MITSTHIPTDDEIDEARCLADELALNPRFLNPVNPDPRARWAEVWRYVRLDVFGLLMDGVGIGKQAYDAYVARSRANDQPHTPAERLRLKKFREERKQNFVPGWRPDYNEDDDVPF